MKILIISPGTSGTIASLAYNLYKAFKLLNVDFVRCVCLSGSNCELPVGIDATVVESSNVLYRIRAIRQIIIDEQIDMTISTLLGCSLWSVLSCTKRDVKVGLFHTRPEQSRYLGFYTHQLFKLVYRYIIPRLDAVVAVNRYAKSAIEAKYGRKTDLIYNIHDFQSIAEYAKEKVEDRRLFTKPTFLFVGHLTPIKGVSRLIRAFEKINIYNEYSLAIVGDGYLATELKQMVQEKNLGESVFFLGYQDNPYKYINRADCLVLPSRDEGLPGVLIEALFLGKRVIATNSSIGVWEIMECDRLYDKNLSENYLTGLGTIVPNLMGPKENDEATINFLAHAMLMEIKHECRDKSDFNYTRFSALEIAPMYMSIYKKFKKE